jgi:DNA polymerase-3 subunit epsilon
MASQPSAEADIFSRPSKFRQSTVVAVWQKAPPVKGKPHHRYDWRNGLEIGPWETGKSRDGLWDVGHIEPWYKVVDRLRRVDGITRQEVLDEFNNIDNLAVEDPETNRRLGSRSEDMGMPRLPYAVEEDILFAGMSAEEEATWRRHFHAQINRKSKAVDERVWDIDEEDPPLPMQIAAKLPVRVVVFDVATSGYNVYGDDRITAITAMELVNGRATGREFLAHTPEFESVAQDFLDFVGDAPLIAHNAPFDVGFVNKALERAGLDTVDGKQVVDTLRLAKKLLPHLPKYDLETLKGYFVANAQNHPHDDGLAADMRAVAEIYAGLVDIAKSQGVQVHDGKYGRYAGVTLNDAAFAEKILQADNKQGFAARVGRASNRTAISRG